MSTHYITQPNSHIVGVAGIFPAGTIVEVDDATHQVIDVMSMATGESLVAHEEQVAHEDEVPPSPNEAASAAPPAAQVIGG